MQPKGLLRINSMEKPSVKKYVKILGKNHSKFVTEQIWECYDKECYSNVTFVCKQNSAGNSGKTLFANKAILAAGSKKLRLMLSDTGDEDVNIIVPESDFHTLEMLLQYIYTGEVIVGHLKNELESLISEWEIGHPQVTPVERRQAQTGEGRSSPTEEKRKAQPEERKEEQPVERTETLPVERREELPIAATLPLTLFPDVQAIAKNTIVGLERCTATISFEDNEPSVTLNIPDDDVSIDIEWENAEDHVSTLTEEDTVLFENIHPVETQGLAVTDPLDIGYSSDTEEDKVDSLLSQAFLKEEKFLNQELTATEKELKEAIDRHELYLKHFVGVKITPLKPRKIRKPQEELRIPCPVCSKDIHRDYMNEHIITIHSTERPFLCEQCGATFPLADRLRKHINRSHPKETVIQTETCTICNREFKNMFYLRRHMSVHTGEKPHQCPFCDKTFRLRSVLVKHKRTHTGEKPYLCSICGKQFATHSTYGEHLKTHGENKKAYRPRWKLGGSVEPVQSFPKQINKCPICGLTFQREYAFLIHEATHTNEEPKLPCRRCPSTFPSLKVLKDHVRDYHADSVFRCDQCANFYNTKWALDKHLLTHTDQNAAFHCTECDKSFLTKIKLGYHMKNVHSTERPYKCRFCPKDFKVKKLLCEHERLHTGERPFQCPHCPKTFRVQVQCTSHVRTHTGEKPYTCVHCGKAFAGRENMRIHMKIHTGNKIQCTKCGKVLRSRVKLELHERTHNEEVYEEEVGADESDDSSQEDLLEDEEEGTEGIVC